ncbi:MEDS domain-containing protein [Geodermatophilus sp. SYSU D00691]
MRAEGLLTDPTGTAVAGHICWVYDDADDLAGAARRYLEEGLAAGDRLLWIGDPEHARLIRAESGPLADVDGLIDRGELEVLDVRAGYQGSAAFVPGEQLAFYDAATRQAVADGFHGLRVVADVSDLAADPDRRADLVRWEHLADEYMASGSGMVALCAYRADLEPEALADVASVHPQVRPRDDGPPFRVWFDGGTLMVGGCVDAFGAERLGRVLGGTHVEGAVVRMDLSRLEFVDVGGCRALARWARQVQERPARVEFVGASRLLRRMWAVLGFDEHVSVAFVEPPA